MKRFKPGDEARIVRSKFPELINQECVVLDYSPHPRSDYRIKVGTSTFKCRDSSLEPIIPTTNPDIEETIAHLEETADA